MNWPALEDMNGPTLLGLRNNCQNTRNSHKKTKVFRRPEQIYFDDGFIGSDLLERLTKGKTAINTDGKLLPR